MTSLPLYGVGFALIGRHVRVCSHVSGCRVRGSFVCLSIVSSEVGLTKMWLYDGDCFISLCICAL